MTILIRISSHEFQTVLGYSRKRIEVTGAGDEDGLGVRSVALYQVE
jgi:hypothetical protein